MTKPLQTTFFTVVGRGTFPIDMLRYDRCWPNSSHDCAVIERPHRHLTSEGGPELRRIELRGIMAPTLPRWHSFGWTVVSIEGKATGMRPADRVRVTS